jgi:hypothetical protein
MRPYVLALAAAALFATPAFSAGIEFGPGGVRVDPGFDRSYPRHYGYRGDCRELRRACLYKEELGEVGQGNCARYRRLCQ